MRAPVVFYNRCNEAAAQLKPGDFDWKSIMAGGVRWFHSGGIFAALSPTTPELVIEGMKAAKAAGAVVSFDLNFRAKLWQISGGLERRSETLRRIVRQRRCARRQRRRFAERARPQRAGSRSEAQARSDRVLRHDGPGGQGAAEHQSRRHDAARSAFDQPARLERGRLDRRQDLHCPDLRTRRASIASAAATALRPASSMAC